MIHIRTLKEDECHRIKEIDASQYIDKAWREVDGHRQLVAINYLDPDWPNGFQEHLDGLKDTLKNEGLVLGAFDGNTLVGVLSLKRPTFGRRNTYVLLDQLFISKNMRGQGIGHSLFFKAAETARLWNANKFYICAGSAEETINFYMTIGCQTVDELNQELYEQDPRDMHLEYAL